MITAAYKPQGPGETVVLNCGNTSVEDVYLADGWDFALKQGYSFQGPQWQTEINYCWADINSLEFDLLCPKGASGTLRLFILDGDNLSGGRKQTVRVAGKLIGEYENFQSGKWIEVPVSATDTASGRIPVVMKNLKGGANAVVSQIRFQTQ